MKKTAFNDHECLEKHADWYEELKEMKITEENVHEVVCQSVSEIFSRVLENAGVFKLDDPKAVEAVCAFIEKQEDNKMQTKELLAGLKNHEFDERLKALYEA